MVKRLAEALGSTASAHVEPVRREARAQSRGPETAHVSGVARAFEAVNHENLARGCNGRPLRFHEHLHIAFRAKEAALDGNICRARGTPPEMASNRLPMRISKQRAEGRHSYKGVAPLAA